MKCHYCETETPLPNMMFVDGGMVPGVQMKRSFAHCGCPINAIDGRPSEPVIEREPGSDDEPVMGDQFSDDYEQEPPF